MLVRVERRKKSSKAIQPKPTPCGRANDSANQDVAVLCCALSLLTA